MQNKIVIAVLCSLMTLAPPLVNASGISSQQVKVDVGITFVGEEENSGDTNVMHQTDKEQPENQDKVIIETLPTTGDTSNEGLVFVGIMTVLLTLYKLSNYQRKRNIDL